MDYPFIVQAWIYQGDYRPSPPQLPSSPPPRVLPGATRSHCATRLLHGGGTQPWAGGCVRPLAPPPQEQMVTPVFRMTKAGPGVMRRSVGSRSWMGAASLGDGGLVPRCPDLLSSCHYFALLDAISWTGITTIRADTLLQFSFPTGLILQSWWLVTLNILHTSSESLRASEGFDCTQGTLHDA